MIRLCLLFILLVSSRTIWAAQCTTVFQDAVSSHSGAGITFEFNAQIINSPDSLLSASSISKNLGSTTPTCTTTDCAVSTGAPVVTSGPGTFQTSGGSTDIFVSFGDTFTLGDLGINRYRDVVSNSETVLNFSTDFSEYFFDSLQVGFQGVLNLQAGTTYWIDELNIGSEVVINVIGTGTAIIFVNNTTLVIDSPTLVNSPAVNSTGDASKLALYAFGNVTLTNLATFSGLIYAQGDLTLGSTSYLFGSSAAQSIALGSNSIATFNSAEVAAASVGSICEPEVLLARYQFGESDWPSANTVIDSSGNGNNASPSGNVQPLSFNGGSCRVLNVPSNSTEAQQDAIDTQIDINDIGDQGTVSFWYRSNLDWSSSVEQQLLDGSTAEGAGDKFYYLALKDNRLTFGMNDADDDRAFALLTGLPFVAQQWVHITVTWDVPNNTMAVYASADGTDYKIIDVDSGFDGTLGDLSTLYVGDNRSDYFPSFTISSPGSADGQFSDVKIFNFVRSETNIAEDAAVAPVCEGQMAFYEFNETSWPSVDTVLDSSGAGNHGSPVGAAVPLFISAGSCNLLDIPANTTAAVQDAVDTQIDMNTVGNQGTISFWYRSNLDWSDSTPRQLIDASNEATSPDKHFYVSVDGGEVEFGIEDADDIGIFAKVTGVNYVAGQWVRVSVTWDLPNNEIQLYLSSFDFSYFSQESNSNFEDELGDMDTLYIGDNRSDYRIQNSTQYSANGQFDDFRIYNTVRSSAQINADASNEPECDGVPPEAVYRLEELDWTSGNSVLDSGGSDNHGSIITTGVPLPGNIQGGTLPSTQVSCRVMDVPANSSETIVEALDTGIDMNDVGEAGTISFWYRSNEAWSSAIGRQLFDASRSVGGDEKYFFLSLAGGELQFGLEDINDDDETITLGSLSYAADEWVHIAIVWDLFTSKLEIYLNGTLAKSETSLALIFFFPEFNTLYFGDNRSTYFQSNSSPNSANGQFDDIRIYGRARTEEQINQDMDDVVPCDYVDHYEISHPESALTCEASTATIKACLNADCSSVAGSVSQITISPFNVPVTIQSNNFTGQDFEISQTTVGNTSLAISSANPVADNPLVCKGEEGSSDCVIAFSNAGFDLYGATVGLGIADQKAGALFNDVNIRAVEDVNGVCVPSLADETIDVTFTHTCTTPASCKTPLEYSGNDIDSELTVQVTFASDGTASLPSFIYNDVGVISLAARAILDSGATINSGSESILVYPDRIDISSTAATINTDAGENFNLEVKALGANGAVLKNYIPGDLEFSLKSDIGPEMGILHYSASGNLDSTTSTSFQTTTINSSDFSDNDGVYSYAANYTEVDQLTFDVRDANYNGKVITNTGSALTLGLFIPAYFEIATTAPSFSNTCEADSDSPIFTYFGQQFGFTNGAGAGVDPRFDLTAYNANGVITTNYRGTYWSWLGDDSILDTINFTDVGHALDIEVVANSGTSQISDIADPAVEFGRQRVDISDWQINYEKAISPVTEHIVSATFTMPAAYFTDTSYGANSICVITGYDKAAPGACEDVVVSAVTGANLRWGRIALDNTFGPENENKLIRVSAEYFGPASKFIRNRDDQCTSFDWPSSAFGVTYRSGTDITGDISVNPDSPPGTSYSFTMIDGQTQGIEGVTVTAPDTGDRGEVVIELLSTGVGLLPWEDYLQFDWDDGTPGTQNPSSIVTFGQFRGNDRIIHWREIF